MKLSQLPKISSISGGLSIDWICWLQLLFKPPRFPRRKLIMVSIFTAPIRVRFPQLQRLAIFHRNFSISGLQLSAGEDKLKRILEENFPQAKEIEVQDVSGILKQMFFLHVFQCVAKFGSTCMIAFILQEDVDLCNQIYIEAEEFRGKRLVEQQRMVNTVCWIDWCSVWPIDWLVRWLIYLFRYWTFHWLIDWLIDNY